MLLLRLCNCDNVNRDVCCGQCFAPSLHVANFPHYYREGGVSECYHTACAELI